MSNHYDPSEERDSNNIDRGNYIKEAIASKHPRTIQYCYTNILTLLNEIEDSIIGGKNIDKLRLARELFCKLITKE